MPLSTAVAIFAIDPGGTTGCATVLADLRQITVAKAMRRARAKGNVVTWEETGTPKEQAWKISRKVVDFYYNVHVERAIVQYNSFYVVTENFHLMQLSADLSPVEVNAGIETLLWQAFNGRWQDPLFQKQMASEAKSFCTDKMLDRWGLLKGKSPHERDATRHAARRLDRML